jgi:hypothetical protein
MSERARRLGLSAAIVAGLESAFFYAYEWSRLAIGNLQGPDFFAFYAEARLVLATGGASMYDFGLQKAFQDRVTSHWPGEFVLLPYMHPPYFSFLIAPLGLLDYRTAYWVWAGVNLFALAAVVALLVAVSQGSTFYKLAVTALIAGFFPLFVTLLQGQSDLVALLPLTGAYIAWSRGRAGWAGILGGLALVKPQLLLVIPLLFLARRAWRALAGFAGVGTVLAAASLIFAGTRALTDYVAIVFTWAIHPAEQPQIAETGYTLRGLLEHLPGGRLPALAVLAGLLLLTALALSWRPDRRRLDFALAVAASVALTPFANLHDLSLLILPGYVLAELARERALRWSNAALITLGLAYAATTTTLLAGPAAAAAGALLLAAYLAAERLAVRPDPLALPTPTWSGPTAHRVIVLPAYKAARTLVEVVTGIPRGHADRILLVDDASSDATVSVATALKLDVIRHPQNLGYGGNQKTCYRQALAMGADVIVMLHPDNQYDPAIIPKLCAVIERGQADIVLGSRWLGLDPAKAGMPWWKRAGNRFLTALENRVLGLELSEYHTGYRAYSRRFLEAIPFLENSDDFVFDTQVLVQAATFGFRIAEVPAVGRYFEEASSVGIRASVVYGLKTLAALARYVAHRAGFPTRWLTANDQRMPLIMRPAFPETAAPGTARS